MKSTALVVTFIMGLITAWVVSCSVSPVDRGSNVEVVKENVKKEPCDGKK
jgi:hypothetical protein